MRLQDVAVIPTVSLFQAMIVITSAGGGYDFYGNDLR